jgi:predicted porin
MKVFFVTAAIAAITTSAFAQGTGTALPASNAIYGTMDVNFNVANTGYGTRKQFSSGGYSPSALGFRGDRDLGNGLKAVYLIEAGLLLDTGVAGNSVAGAAGINNDQPSSGGQTGTGVQLFSRQAYAGLSSERMGTFTIGRQYAGSYVVAVAYGTALSGVYAGSGGLLGVNGLPSRMNNSIVYLSPKYNGLSVNASYTLGAENNIDMPTASGAGTATAKSGAGYDLAGYFNSPKLNAAVSTWRIANATYAPGESSLAHRTGWQLAANYDFEVIKVYGSVTGAKIRGGNYENVTKTLSSSLGYGISAMVPVGANRFYISYASLNDKSLNDRDARLFGAVWARNLDARTVVYAGYGNLQNNSRASYTMIDSGSLVGKTVPGYSPKALAVGVNLTF